MSKTVGATPIFTRGQGKNMQDSNANSSRGTAALFAARHVRARLARAKTSGMGLPDGSTATTATDRSAVAVVHCHRCTPGAPVAAVAARRCCAAGATQPPQHRKGTNDHRCLSTAVLVNTGGGSHSN